MRERNLYIFIAMFAQKTHNDDKKLGDPRRHHLFAPQTFVNQSSHIRNKQVRNSDNLISTSGRYADSIGSRKDKKTKQTKANQANSLLAKLTQR